MSEKDPVPTKAKIPTSNRGSIQGALSTVSSFLRWTLPFIELDIGQRMFRPSTHPPRFLTSPLPALALIVAAYLGLGGVQSAVCAGPELTLAHAATVLSSLPHLPVRLPLSTLHILIDI
jgi:hypothetical protein